MNEEKIQRFEYMLWAIFTVSFAIWSYVRGFNDGLEKQKVNENV